jgi:hypothetical protein
LVIFTVHASSFVFRAHLQVHFSTTTIQISIVAEVLGFFFNEIVLLWTEDRAWSHDSDPANESGCWELIMFHSVKTDKCASTAQACLAMD